MAWKICFSLIYVLLYMSHCEAQIPTVCLREESLPAGGSVRKCCPDSGDGECGVNAGRGSCVMLPNTTRDPNDVRVNWPAFYFTHVCQCNSTGNYGGVDCGFCAYGYYPSGTGSDRTCVKMSTVERKNLNKYTPAEWRRYRNIIEMIRTQDSEYKAIFNSENFDPIVGFASLSNEIKSLTLYEYFVWTHYLVAQHSEPESSDMYVKKDFAHESTGFLTWHRQMLLWLEWEIQRMINDYSFRLPFWDWTDEATRFSHFDMERLGTTLYDPDPQHSDDLHRVQGELFQNWQTICWHNKKRADGQNCDPSVETGVLKRCPRRMTSTSMHTDPCGDHTYWPTPDIVRTALTYSDYDALEISNDENPQPRYSACPSSNSFRTYLEGFIPQDETPCTNSIMCTLTDPEDDDVHDCNKLRRLHNRVHILLGIADLDSNNSIDENKIGVMGHVAASPNDPIFINHHAMIDCIFDEWLKNQDSNTLLSAYPNPPASERYKIPDGHRLNDNIVPFLPLFSHRHMFKKAENFGYKCNLDHITNPPTPSSPSPSPSDVPGKAAEALAPLSVVTILISVGVLILTLHI